METKIVKSARRTEKKPVKDHGFKWYEYRIEFEDGSSYLFESRDPVQNYFRETRLAIYNVFNETHIITV